MSGREEVREGVESTTGPDHCPPSCTMSSHLLEHPYWPLQIQALHTMLSMSLSLINYFTLFLPSLFLNGSIYTYAQIKIHLLAKIK